MKSLLKSTSTEHQLTHRLHPNAPTNLVASSTTATGTTLNWDVVVGAESYNVYQDGEVIATPATNTYIVGDLTTATEYEFYVTAVDTTEADADVESNPSNTITVVTL